MTWGSYDKPKLGTVWVVTRSTGSYGDYDTEIAGAYAAEFLAQLVAKQLDPEGFRASVVELSIRIDTTTEIS